MKHLFIVFLLMLSFLIRAEENDINRAISRYDYHQALNLLLKEKTTLSNEFLKVQCYKNLMLYDEAISILEQLAVTDSVNLQVMNGLSDLYQTTGKYFKANTILKKLLQIQPENRFFALAYTANLFKMKEWEQTLVELHKNLQTDSLPQLLSMAGDCYWQLDKNDSAIHFYKKALVKSPDDFNSTTKLARIYLQTKQYQALTNCTNDYRSIDSCNKTVNQYNGIGYCYLQEYDIAIKRLKKLYEEGEKSFTTNFYLGSSYYGIQDYYEADDFLSQAYKKDSTNLNLIYYLGRSATFIGKFEKGTSLLERGIELLIPKDTVLFNFYQNLATGYARWKKPQMAFDCYAECLKLMPNSKMTVYKMAGIMDYDLKNSKQALIYYNQFLSLFPKEAENKIENENENSTPEMKGTYYSAVKNRIEKIKETEFFDKKK